VLYASKRLGTRVGEETYEHPKHREGSEHDPLTNFMSQKLRRGSKSHRDRFP